MSHPKGLFLWCEQCDGGVQIGEHGALGPWLYHEYSDAENFSEFYRAHQGHRIVFGSGEYGVKIEIREAITR